MIPVRTACLVWLLFQSILLWAVQPCEVAEPSRNLLVNSHFTELVPAALPSENITAKSELPAGWNVSAAPNAPQMGGSISVVQKEWGNELKLVFPHNTANAVKILSPAISSQATINGLFCGFWAKGRGTVTVELTETTIENGDILHLDSFALVPEWHFYRTQKVTNWKEGHIARLSFAPYGEVSLAFPEVAPLPAVDKSADLRFWTPFENGALDAVFSVGTCVAMGPPDEPAVPGVSGTAIRLDRKLRLASNGALRYPLGFGYDFLQDVLSPEQGTLEFFFRPLPEILEPQEWPDIPLFFLGDTTWQWANAQDFCVRLELHNSNLFLVLEEGVRQKQWPSGANTPVRTVKATKDLGKAEAFVAHWHHFAFTYDSLSRHVWLNGQHCLELSALKQPAITSRFPKLLFAQGHLGHPATMLADLDELRIYNGVRYHSAFTPQISPESLRPAPKAISYSWEPQGECVCTGEPVVRENSLELPLRCNHQDYRLRLEIGEGRDLLFAAKNNVTRMRADFLPSTLSRVRLGRPIRRDASALTVPLPDVETELALKWEYRNRQLTLALHLTKQSGDLRAFLQPKVTLEKITGASWLHFYDGQAVRPTIIPFRPCEVEGIYATLPMAAAWDGANGLALALSPTTICGYLKRGMPSSRSVSLTVRTVLAVGEHADYQFMVVPFIPGDGVDGLVENYHATYPGFFRIDKEIAPGLVTNNFIEKTWENASFQNRKEKWSFNEVARRARAGWCWFYHTGSSTGNWSIDPELLSHYPPINLPYRGDEEYNRTTIEDVEAEVRRVQAAGITPACYISYWGERRLANLFQDSVIRPDESYNGIDTWPDYWKKGCQEQVFLADGGSYGMWLRRQARRFLEQHPSVNAFAFDLCGYPYNFRKSNSLGGLNVFDEHGFFVPQAVALAHLLDDLRAMPNGTRKRTGIAANVHLQLSSFNASFRVDNTIHEEQLLLTLQNTSMRRQQVRIFGEKPTNFYLMPPLDGNFLKKTDDIRVVRYSSAWLHHAQILIGLLYNIRQGIEILGCRESFRALRELQRVQRLGYRQVAGVVASPGIEFARYGNDRQSTVVAVNLSPWEMPASLKLDRRLFTAFPVVGCAGSTVQAKGVSVSLGTVPPLDFLCLDILGNATELPEYEATMMRRLDRTFVTLRFPAGGKMSGLRLAGHPTITFSGQQIDMTRPVILPPGGTIELTYANPLWQCSTEELLQLDYLKDNHVKAEGDGAAPLAARIGEFLNLWSKEHLNEYRECIVSDLPAQITVCVQDGLQASISLQDGRVAIRGALPEVAAAVTDFLALLEEKYPCDMPFGKQQPTSPLDWGATPRQSRFIKQGDLIGKPMSVQELAREFRAFLQENKIHPTKGF